MCKFKKTFVWGIAAQSIVFGLILCGFQWLLIIFYVFSFFAHIFIWTTSYIFALLIITQLGSKYQNKSNNLVDDLSWKIQLSLLAIAMMLCINKIHRFLKKWLMKIGVGTVFPVLLIIIRHIMWCFPQSNINIQ
jgi:hypothetical protein